MKPEVGMGVTVQMYTDRVVFTIVHVSKTGKFFRAVRDNCIRTDNNGMSDYQSYRYEPGSGEPVRFSFGPKSGLYRAKNFGYATLGVRKAYHDFGF